MIWKSPFIHKLDHQPDELTWILSYKVATNLYITLPREMDTGNLTVVQRSPLLYEVKPI